MAAYLEHLQISEWCYGTAQFQLHFYTRGTMIKLHRLPVTCLRGPYFFVAWNIHASCGNTRGITWYMEEHGSANLHVWCSVAV